MKQQEDLHAEIALYILGILTLDPASLADQSSQHDSGDTHPLHWPPEFRKLKSPLLV